MTLDVDVLIVSCKCKILPIRMPEKTKDRILMILDSTP